MHISYTCFRYFFQIMICLLTTPEDGHQLSAGIAGEGRSRNIIKARVFLKKVSYTKNTSSLMAALHSGWLRVPLAGKLISMLKCVLLRWISHR